MNKIRILCLLQFCLCFGGVEGAEDLADSIDSCNCDTCQHDSPSRILEAYTSLSFGRTIGVDHSYSTLGAWYASIIDENLFFIDTSWSHLSKNQNAANAGFGARFGRCSKWIGTNLYFDYLAEKKCDLYQLSGTIEGQYCFWRGSLNVYLPLKSRYTYSKENIEFDNLYHFSSKTVKYSVQLATLKIGRSFDISNTLIPNIFLTISAGPYWVSHSKEKNKYGCLAETDFRFYNLLSWKTIVSNDPIFNTRTQMIVSITIPLCCNCPNYLCCPFIDMYARPDRFNIIPTDTKSFCYYNW